MSRSSSLPPDRFDLLFLRMVDRITEVAHKEEGHDLLREIARNYGLNHAAYLGMNIRGLTATEPYVSVTYSDEWVMHYKSQSFVEIDPVLSASLRSILPIDWSELDGGNQRVRRMFGESREFGVGRQGLTIPIRGRHGEMAIFSVTSDLSAKDWLDFKRIYMRDFQTLAVHIHQMVLKTEGVIHEDVHLAPREIECLQLVACGLTFQEAAFRIGLSDRTVRFYLDLARHKLQCLNVTHAVARALSLDLIKTPER